MIKNNRGVTLVSLIVLVIVLLILVSIFVSTGLSSLTETKDSKTQNEIHALQEAISVRYMSFLKNEDSVLLVGERASTRWGNATECYEEVAALSEVKDLSDDRKTKILNTIVSDFDSTLRIVSYKDAKILGVESFDENNVYLVDYSSSLVYGPLNH